MPHTPLTAESFAISLERYVPASHSPRLAVAVSGGADSMALVLLAHQWAKARGGEIVALTVDHGLRPESTEEAQWVQQQLQSRGMSHQILTWESKKPESNIQQQAREARYALLSEYCRAQGIEYLLTAHHQDDQAETVLLRLLRGSGVTGLAGIPVINRRDGVTVLRPLLGFSKQQLVTYLEQAGVPWAEDPTNQSDKYTRNRVRQWLAGLDNIMPDEVTAASRIAESAARLADTKEALDYYVAQSMASCVEIHDAGYATLPLAPFKDIPKDIGLRVLSTVLQAMGGGCHPPRFESLAPLYRQLIDRSLPPQHTLAGCTLFVVDTILYIMREQSAVASPMAFSWTQETSLELQWDKRFICRINVVPGGLPAGEYTLSTLGYEGVRFLEAEAKSHLPDLPRKLLCSFPALYTLDVPCVVPHIRYSTVSVEGIAWQSLFRRDEALKLQYI